VFLILVEGQKGEVNEVEHFGVRLLEDEGWRKQRGGAEGRSLNVARRARQQRNSAANLARSKARRRH
jgi:hypothetical protein